MPIEDKIKNCMWIGFCVALVLMMVAGLYIAEPSLFHSPPPPDTSQLHPRCDGANGKGYWVRYQIVAYNDGVGNVYDYVFVDWMNESDQGRHCNE